MNIYIGTCIPGLEEVAADAVKKKLHDVEIKSIHDGLVIYATDASYDQLQQLNMFNNIFSLIKTFHHTDSTQKEINKMMKDTLYDANVFYHVKRKLPSGKKKFRIIVSYKNQMIHTDKNVLIKLEEKIIKECHIGLDPLLPDVEFWYLMRQEGEAYFCIRLTKHTEYAKILAKGELHPELCFMLGFLADITLTDTLLDPFAGSGAIPFMCEKAFHCKKIIANDSDTNATALLKTKVQSNNSHVEVLTQNALAMESIPNQSIDAIVTDPPWGVTLGKDLDLSMFYTDMLREWIRILALHGRIVILLAKKDIFAQVIATMHKNLILQKSYDILVSGQKAGIYCLEKN